LESLASPGGRPSTGSTQVELRRPIVRKVSPALIGAVLLISGWTLLWSIESLWNPLAFWALWTGAALLLWAGSPTGYPSFRRHVALAAISVPLWWWFEFVNERIANWEYAYNDTFPPVMYLVLSSIAFSTVVPAMVAAMSWWERVLRPVWLRDDVKSNGRATAWVLILLGAILNALVFALPDVLYPFTWIAPFLIVDGMLVANGGRSMAMDLIRGHWREATLVGAAGLTCGLLWEFWNYWAYPKWEYDIPFLGFGKLFEMPILGYGGYIPFAWSVVQTVRFVDAIAERVSGARRIADPRRSGPDS
jgi:hypothetical protein